MYPQESDSRSTTPRPIHRRKQTISSHTRTPIFVLPTEVMIMVFRVYYHLSQAPIVLLLVCRRWHGIALHISSLWTTIRFEPWRKQYSILPLNRTIHLPIICISWKQLKSAVSHAGELKLNLTCDLANFDEVCEVDHDAPSWLFNRCQYLRINQSCTPAGKFLQSLGNLENLEDLAFGGSYEETEAVMVRVLQVVEAQSSLLSVLEVSSEVAGTLIKFLSILPRIRKFTHASNSVAHSGYRHEHIIIHLTGIRELSWSLGSPSHLHAIAGNLQALKIQGCSSFPAYPLGRLTTLTLTYRSLRLHEPVPVYLPVLRYLNFTGPWGGFSVLHAPLLTTLELQLFGRDCEVSVPNSRPKVLTTDENVSDERLVRLLKGDWSDLEELHWLCSPWHQDLLGSWLVDSLAGNISMGPLCPQLRTFTVKTRVNPIRWEESEEGTIVAQLRSIIRSRRIFLSNGLSTVRYWWEGSGGVYLN